MDYFILSVPTQDSRAVPKSIMDLMTVSEVLKRKFVLNVQNGTGVANVRQKCIDTIKKMFPNEKFVYTFWLDSDIVITYPNKVADFIIEAEKLGVSFTGNYHALKDNTGEVHNTVWKNGTQPYTNEELDTAKPFDLKVYASGLGLCYIKTPLNYEFRTEGHKGEDYLFLQDNPEIDLRYVPIPNYHIKTVYI